MMEEQPLNKTLNLIDNLASESCASAAGSCSNVDPLEHHKLLCDAASTFTLYPYCLQPPPSTTATTTNKKRNKRKEKEIAQAEKESAAPDNNPKRRKLVLTSCYDQKNIIELKSNTTLVIKDNDNESSLGVTSADSSVMSTALPAHDEDLMAKSQQQETKDDNANSIVRPTVGTNEDRNEERSLVRRSDPAKFNITKKLGASDLGGNSRLLVPKSKAEEHILPMFDEELIKRMEEPDGLDVIIFDEVRQKEYEMKFKYLKSANGYFFNKKWVCDFVKVLELKEGDVIGLYLDSSSISTTSSVIVKPKFHFSVLKLAGQDNEGSPDTSASTLIEYVE